MSVEILASGSYRYRFRIEGQDVRFTLKQKLSDRAARDTAIKMLSEKKSRSPGSKTILFSAAAQYYLDTTENSLSPSTRRLYRGYKKHLEANYPWFTDLKLTEIDSPVLQRLIGEYASSKDESGQGHARGSTRSPKTVKNMYLFLCSVFNLFDPGKKFSVRLPAVQREEPYIPTDEDVMRIMEYVRSSEALKRYYVPLVLAALGLRRSEICALELADLDGSRLTVSKAKVRGPSGWVVKNTMKTEASRRTIIIPDSLADMIREQGYIYRGEPCMLNETLERVQKKLGIPRFTVHKLRHFYASSAIALGVPVAFVERSGGWTRGSSVLSRIYTHTQDAKKIDEMDRITLNHISTLT